MPAARPHGAISADLTVIASALAARLLVPEREGLIGRSAPRSACHAFLQGPWPAREKIVPDFDCQLLESIGDLRRVAPAWDGLWQRSHCANPSARAEPLAQWIEHFAPRTPLRIVVVRRHGEPLAALPLLGRGPRPLRVGFVPGNDWSSAGALLVDSAEEQQAVLDCLVRGLRRFAWPLLRLDAALPENPGWRNFGVALQRSGIVALTRPRCRVDQIDVGGDWSSYLAGRTYNQRRQIRRLVARAGADTKLLVLEQFAPDELTRWLRQGFAIEDQGWKGRAGTSVLKNPSIFDFYLRQARHFAETGALRLVFLEHQGRSIAFEYGWQAKGVYSPLKVAYDETVHRLSPGQLLRALLVERFCADPVMRQVDFLGPSSRATRDFSTGDYPVARMLVALHPLAAPVVKTYQLLSPIVRRFRGEPSQVEMPAGPPPPVTADLPIAPEAEPVPA